MLAKTVIEPKNVWKSTPYKFSQAIRAGNLLFIAGQAGIDPSGKIVSKDVNEQIKQAFENIRNILEEAGASFDDVVKITAYFVDINDYPKYVEILSQYIKKDYPVSTVVEVSRLALPDLLVEIEAIAVLSENSR